MNTLVESLDEVHVGKPQTFQNLSMYPLFSNHTVKANYWLLDEALQKDYIEIQETSESGSVPELKVLNKCGRKILLLDGEELLGAKQNRILNLSVMVPAKTEITIPVSCVESGRWSRQSRNFRSAGRIHFAESRARNARRVNTTMRSSGSKCGDQSAVWREIAMKSERMHVFSNTNASDAMYSKHETKLNEFLGAFQAVPKQAGAAFTLNGEISGIDLFDSSKALKGYLPKLLQSHALDAVDFQGEDSQKEAVKNVEEFLNDIGKAHVDCYPSVGKGNNYHRFDEKQLSGGALWVDGHVVHLSAFRVADLEA